MKYLFLHLHEQGVSEHLIEFSGDNSPDVRKIAKALNCCFDPENGEELQLVKLPTIHEFGNEYGSDEESLYSGPGDEPI